MRGPAGARTVWTGWRAWRRWPRVTRSWTRSRHRHRVAWIMTVMTSHDIVTSHFSFNGFPQIANHDMYKVKLRPFLQPPSLYNINMKHAMEMSMQRHCWPWMWQYNLLQSVKNRIPVLSSSLRECSNILPLFIFVFYPFILTQFFASGTNKTVPSLPSVQIQIMFWLLTFQLDIIFIFNASDPELTNYTIL